MDGSWTVDSLEQAMAAAAGEIEVRRIDGAEPVLMATMKAFGDLPVYLTVAGEQIVVSALLWPVAEQQDQAEFNRFLLKAQKTVPLSNFAITEVDGTEFYELIGELATDSSLDAILLELRVLAQNALDAAGELRGAAFAAA
ncbi:MAG: hypothetical protein AVDCRST_MAG39-333 [uncultured Sphingomonadaceae bacterium]|uniref:DUF2170 family protein n=1 Tax=uncultured Sphingomonadaceae bacterium TaxID=169976 RepID=A0A6J4RU59_9SPHN|nr:MAG: hypothetical protein AVDCRST_MAG39-333 [uncultured Sphingomonadaceae bacterium]